MVSDEAPSAARACGICAIIGRIESGSFDDLVAELPRSWLILGDAQFYRGYCVLFAKRHVTELHLMPRGSQLTHAETNAVIALREAGMRIEVARGLDQAMARVREMGVVLKDDDRRQMRDHYRGETRRGRWS